MEDLGQHLYDENLDNPEEKKEALKRDVQLIAKHCPSLRRMEVYLYGDVPYIQEGDYDIWESLPEKLPNLSEISLHAHEWNESVALVSVITTYIAELSLHNHCFAD